jgi:hypothetical protein
VPEPPATLRQDMTVSIDIEVGRRERALVLPIDAVDASDSAGPPHALVVREGRVARVPIALGLRGVDRVEVLEGLTEGEAVLPLGTESYYRSSTLRLTNCVAYAGTDTSTTQGLDGVTVEVRIGREGTNNVAYTGTVVEASSGSWWADVTVPDSDSVYLQLKLTDTNSASYIYPWKIIRTKEALQ